MIGVIGMGIRNDRGNKIKKIYIKSKFINQYLYINDG